MAKEQNVQAITDKEILETFKILLRKKSNRDWFLFTLGVNTGMKIKEMIDLRVRDIKNKTHIVIEEKQYSIKKLEQEINEYVTGMEDDDYLFPSNKKNKNGKLEHVNQNQPYKTFEFVAKEMGLNYIGTQTMKKTYEYFAQQAIEQMDKL